ncbi:MAG TPA: hypothetical protein VII58_04305 [Acidobacteriaceae bacterium]
MGSHVSTELPAEDRAPFVHSHGAEPAQVSVPGSSGQSSDLKDDHADEDSDVAPVWLQRLSLIVLVLFCLYLGVLVAVLPWWTRIWDQNLFINSHPALAAVLHNGAVRGLVSGLGLLDIWIGLSEAIHYRDQRP